MFRDGTVINNTPFLLRRLEMFSRTISASSYVKCSNTCCSLIKSNLPKSFKTGLVIST